MTGNCRTLAKLEDEPGYLQINIKDAEKLGIKNKEIIRVSSRRGSVLTKALVTDIVQEGATYMTYQWWVGDCNELTVSSLDPISKTPEYKYCAIKIEKIEDQNWAKECVKNTYNVLKAKIRV